MIYERTIKIKKRVRTGEFDKQGCPICKTITIQDTARGCSYAELNANSKRLRAYHNENIQSCKCRSAVRLDNKVR